MTFEDPLSDREKEAIEVLSRKAFFKYEMKTKWKTQVQQPGQQQTVPDHLHQPSQKQCQQSKQKNQIQHVLCVQQTETHHAPQQVPSQRQQSQQGGQPKHADQAQITETHHLPQQGPPQNNDLPPETNDGWQSDSDAPHRKEIKVKIAHLWRKQPEQRTPNALQFGWLKRLYEMAKELEETLYRLASSFDDYQDKSTLTQRVQMVVITKQRLQLEAPSQQQDFPCPGLIGGWQKQSDAEDRKMIIVKIIRFLKGPNGPQEWLEEIPVRTQKLEAILYKLANSLEEYKDEKIMTQRLHFVVPTMQLLQQQEMLQQQKTNQGEMADDEYDDNWISGDDRTHRLEMVIKIMFIFEKKIPHARWEWFQKIPGMAKQFEGYLYKSAKSLEEYQDETTLAQRLNLVSAIIENQLHRKTPQTIQEHFVSNNRQEAMKNGEWRSDRDVSLRLEKVMRVTFLLKNRKQNPSERFLLQLPEMAKQFEEYLYRSADSLDEYQDDTTLAQRLNLVVSMTNQLQQEPPKTPKALQPYSSNRQRNRGWRSDSDMPRRREKVFRIIFLLKQRRPDAPHKFSEQIPEMAIQLEESLYRLANSFDEYEDDDTLVQRLKNFAINLGITSKSVQQCQLAVARQQQQQDDHYPYQDPAPQFVSSPQQTQGKRKRRRSSSSESRKKK